MIGFGPLLLVDSGLSLIDGPSPKPMLADSPIAGSVLLRLGTQKNANMTFRATESTNNA